MRLLYVIPSEGFGGAERQAVYHIAHLPRWGIEVVPLVGPGRLIVEQLAREGVYEFEFSTDMLHEPGVPQTGLAHAANVASTAATWFRGLRAIHRAVRRHGIDAIFAGRTTGYVMAGLAARWLGIPAIWRAGSRPRHAVHRCALRWYAAVARPAGIVCNCRAVQAGTEPLVDAPCPVVYNGVDLRRFDPATTPDVRCWSGGVDPTETVTVGMSGRPAPGKGLEVLADALELLALPARRLRVLIAGDYGWREHYQRFFAERGLGNQVTLIGHVAEVERFLRCCDILVLPSQASSSEGLPNTLLEAMAMRCAVVATRVVGVAEAVEDGRSGLLVAPDDPRELAGAIGALLQSEHLRAELGRRARETVERRFSLEASVARLAETIQRLLGGARVRARDVLAPQRRLDAAASIGPPRHTREGSA